MGIPSACGDQGLVAAVFDDTSIIYNEYAVSPCGRGQAVRDDHGGAAHHRAVGGVKHGALGSRVQGGRGLVQQQHARLQHLRALAR